MPLLRAEIPQARDTHETFNGRTGECREAQRTGGRGITISFENKADHTTLTTYPCCLEVALSTRREINNLGNAPSFFVRATKQGLCCDSM